jgi:dTDP-4-amino-4,6-dideoxygalactose transaminase
MSVPFVDISAQYSEIAQDVEPELLHVLRTGNYVGGQYLERFESAMCYYLHVNNTIGVSSGTDAIMVALEALGIGKGDNVIVPANSFVASAFGVTRAGAKPVFVDVDPDTYLLDLNQVEKLIKRSKKIKAILAVHLYGQMPNMEELYRLSRENKVYLIEDAAQAIGATFNGRNVGYYSDIAVTSFYPTKNLWTIGQGGAIIVNDSTIADKIRTIINQGSQIKYKHICLGGNYRLDTLMAVQLYHALRKLDEWNNRRRKIAYFYNDAFGSEHRPTQNPNSRHIYHLYEYKCKTSHDRDALELKLKEACIGYGFHYPQLISEMDLYKPGANKTPIAADLCKRLISLPMFPNMTEDQAETVVKIVTNKYQNFGS